MKTMETAHCHSTCCVQPARRGLERGIALVTTLLLLMLFMAVTVGMVISATSDTLITRYYRTFRSSFYAGDSGVNIARQYMANELVANANVAIGTTFASNGTPPLSGTDASTTLTDVLNEYSSSNVASYGQVNSGQGANSWPGKFYLVQTLTNTPGTTLSAPTCTPKFTPPTSGTVSPATGPYDCGANYPTCSVCTGFAITDFDYTFPYTITAVGQSTGSEQQVVEDEGNLVLDIHVAPSNGSKTAFSAWGMFIDKWTECSGSTLVPGTITGPVFTNGAWTFGTSGQYIFTDPVGSVQSTFGYQFSGKCDSNAASSDKSGSTTIAPTFQHGYTLGANSIPLPTDSFNQKEAVVDGVGTSCAGSSSQCPSNAVMSTTLRDINGSQYPSTGASSGVFLGYSQTTSGGVTTRTMTGGGILVEGNASVVMTAGAGKTQIFTITQGSTTTTVTVDITNNKTTIQSGSTTTTVTGVPDNYGGSSPTPSTMLYVDGSISSLSGPSSGAAVQDGYGTTVTAKNDITVTGNILYNTEPVTMTQNQIPNTPADTLIPGNNNGQVLGIFTAGGNVNLQVPTSGQNLEIDASIATISKTGSGAIVNTGNAINTLTIVGGRIQNTIQNINSTTRNVFFDRRFTQGGFAPPWFPSTTVTATGQDSVQSVTATAQRTLWYVPSF
jgi:PilX N-terminal